MTDTKPLTVKDPRRATYTRTIKTRPITFTCQRCNLEVTEELYPGAAPKYCNNCVRDTRREQATARQRKHRARP